MRLYIYCIGLLLVWFSATSVAAAQKPNVLLIMIDDLNDWVGPLAGHPQVQTPNLDRLAARGMTFTNAHATATSCNPSRTSLFSGLRPSTSGIYGNYPDWRIVEELKGITMFPAHFRQHGYYSSGGGKVFHAHTYWDFGMVGNNDPDSWDSFYPAIDRQMPNGIYPIDRKQNGNPGGSAFMGFDWYGLTTEDHAMGDGQVVSWAVNYIKQPFDQPRFTAVGIYRPHLPWYVPKKYMDMYPLDSIQIPQVPTDDLDDVPEVVHQAAMHGRTTHEWVVKENKWQEAVQAYLASISFADAMVGRVLDALDASGQVDNTIIVLASDHGWMLGHKLRWRKMALWRQTTRIPLIIVAPDVATPGSRTHKPVTLLDIYPTLVELASLPDPEHQLDGNSLVPLLKDADADWGHAAISSWGYMNHAIQDQRYRYIRYKDGGEELYDHESDPHEWNNLANSSKYRNIKNRLARALPKINIEGLCPDPMQSPPPRPECASSGTAPP